MPAVQGTLLLRRWALNPVLMRQLFQQLNGTDRVKQDVYGRIAVSDPQAMVARSIPKLSLGVWGSETETFATLITFGASVV